MSLRPGRIHLAEDYHERTGCGIPIRSKALRERCTHSMDRVWNHPDGCRRCRAGWAAFVRRWNGTASTVAVTGRAP